MVLAQSAGAVALLRYALPLTIAISTGAACTCVMQTKAMAAASSCKGLHNRLFILITSGRCNITRMAAYAALE